MDKLSKKKTTMSLWTTKVSRRLWQPLLGLALTALGWVLADLVWAATNTENTPRDHVEFYIETYQRADPTTYPAVARAYRVFEQVRRVADRPRKYRPRLVVIDSPGDPWAITLPDGYIVLSKRAVEIAYLEVPPTLGDARVAFILGHELAHLANHDFWHGDVYRALVGSSDPASVHLRKLLRQGADVGDAEEAQRITAIRLKEAEADDRGFLYAGLAGYAVDSLLGEAVGRAPSFFQHWMQQTQTRLDPEHPRPNERARLLHVRLQGLASKLPFFHYGVRLMHFGGYADAAYFLRTFQTTFPSREVFNNLGYGLLQQARNAMPPTLAYRYCLPVRLDAQSRADALVALRGESGEETLPTKARAFLEQAAEYLERAREADAYYRPTRLNLAVAYLYLGEIFKARAVIEEARALTPEAAEVSNLRALILYRDQLAVDMWPSAVKILEDLAAAPEASWCVVYNLAQMLEDRGHDAKAAPLWERLVGQAAELPSHYRQRVCSHAAAVPACWVSRTGKPAETAAPPWPLPIPLGLDLLDSQHPENQAGQVFAGWLSLPFDWQRKGLNGHVYRHPEGASVLVLDGFVEMVVLSNQDLGTAETLLSCCGPPTAKSVVTHGTIWSYGTRWAALVQDGRVWEVWVARR